MTKKSTKTTFFIAETTNIQKEFISLHRKIARNLFAMVGDTAWGIVRRDAGVVDRAALEMRCTGNCTGGSNPSLSAVQQDRCLYNGLLFYTV